MSNIANQIVAVVATLLGFVAHDALRERDAAQTAVMMSGPEIAIDPVVTRSVNLGGLSADSFGETPGAEREAQARPSMRASDATVAARPDSGRLGTGYAEIRVNHVRVAAPRIRSDAFIR